MELFRYLLLNPLPRDPQQRVLLRFLIYSLRVNPCFNHP